MEHRHPPPFGGVELTLYSPSIVPDIDIAGAEKGFPAVDHRETFEVRLLPTCTSHLILCRSVYPYAPRLFRDDAILPYTFFFYRQLAHKNFLFKTVHGGEDWGPESIFQVGDTCIKFIQTGDLVYLGPLICAF